jgi:hypothetical protein
LIAIAEETMQETTAMKRMLARLEQNDPSFKTIAEALTLALSGITSGGDTTAYAFHNGNYAEAFEQLFTIFKNQEKRLKNLKESGVKCPDEGGALEARVSLLRRLVFLTAKMKRG